ncbi:hypothetical protein [Sphingomonas faeni]|uniref:hypothetical protein n=1 Tax=Sphingomonas faeni TaxID=185950 RepID=UPI003362B950
MARTIVQLRGGKGLTAAEQAFLAGQIAEPTQAALVPFLRAPALEAAGQARADVDALIAATGTAFGQQKAALDIHVAAKDALIDEAITELGETTSQKVGEVDDAIAASAAQRASIRGDLDAKAPSLVAAYSGAQPRALPDRLRVRTLGDTPQGILSVGAWINAAIQAAPAGSVLDFEARLLNIAAVTIVLKGGVKYDWTGCQFTHTGTAPFLTAADQSDIEFIGHPKIIGPMSTTNYAFQFTRCTRLIVPMFEYYNGNSGVLITDCIDAHVTIHGHEMRGPNMAVKGPANTRVVIASKCRNGAGFGIFGDNFASGVHVLYTIKWVDETKVAVGSFIESQYEIAYETSAGSAGASHKTLGEEAIGLTFSTSSWTVDYLYGHRTGDGAASLTGNYHTIKYLRAVECYLNGVHASGRGSRVDFVRSIRNGHYSAGGGNAIYGGFAASAGSSAGGVAIAVSFGKIVSTGDLLGGGRADTGYRYPMFAAGGVCKQAGMYWDGGAGIGYVFRIVGKTPDNFGPTSPAAAGWTVPASDSMTSSTFSDGVSTWAYRTSFSLVDGGGPAARNCVWGEIDYDGPGLAFVDNVGPSGSNLYPSVSGAPFSEPPILINGEFHYWPNGGSVQVSAATTAAETAGGWYGARTGGPGFSVSQVTGYSRPYAMRLQRAVGDTATGTPYVGQQITGEDVYKLRGKKVGVKYRAAVGSGWSDNDGKLSWSILTSNVVQPLDADLNPAAAVSLSNGAQSVTASADSYTFASAGTVPMDAEAIIIRWSYSPVGTAVANDYLDIEAPVIGPADATFAFVAESLATTRARLGVFGEVIAAPGAPQAAGTVSGSSSGLYATPRTMIAGGTPFTPTDTEWRFYRIVPYNIAITELAIEVVVAGPAGCKIRMAIYANAGNRPGALLADGGEMSAETVGVKSFAVSVPASKDARWLAYQVTASPGTLTIRSSAAGFQELGATSFTTVIKGLATTNAAYGAASAVPLTLAATSIGPMVGAR